MVRRSRIYLGGDQDQVTSNGPQMVQALIAVNENK